MSSWISGWAPGGFRTTQSPNQKLLFAYIIGIRDKSITEVAFFAVTNTAITNYCYAVDPTFNMGCNIAYVHYLIWLALQ